MKRLLPAKPLKEFMEMRNQRPSELKEMVSRAGNMDADSAKRQIMRVLHGEIENLRYSTADMIACALGVHPTAIWGRLWEGTDD